VWLHELKSFLKGSGDKGIENAIGGNFECFGKIMADLLIDRGLTSDSFLVDVGCGSGRLTKSIDKFLSNGDYLGIDIIPRLVKHASQQTANPNFEFKVSSGSSIPADDDTADMVCFFSVFTHILHEQTYRYLLESKRVLKKQGKIVFSFLEFGIPEHWPVFENNVNNAGQSSKHLDMFISRDAIVCWAEKLDLEVEGIWDGHKPHIPLSASVVTDEGTKMEETGWLGQSVCVLKKS